MLYLRLVGDGEEETRLWWLHVMSSWATDKGGPRSSMGGQIPRHVSIVKDGDRL